MPYYPTRRARPNAVRITQKDKNNLLDLKKGDGIDRGFFFDSCGRLFQEHINPTRHYNYLWTTEGTEPNN